MEQTLILLKPDVVQRGLVGTIVRRIERRGLRIAAKKMMWMTPELAERHYGEHKGKPFYEPLVRVITTAPLIAMVVTGPEAISIMRTMMGPTNSKEASPGTIRGDFGLSNRHNLIHGSDSPESAEREIPLFFAEEEIFDYGRPTEPWSDPDATW